VARGSTWFASVAGSNPAVASDRVPAVHGGRIAVRPMLPLTLSFDHAVVDGAPAARFTETFRGLIETAAAFDEIAVPSDH
jgi:pyruvate/2-oxoglutarate dehydrogenase complex dihydrolipoamide acyltransferase (E2) component